MNIIDKKITHFSVSFYMTNDPIRQLVIRRRREDLPQLEYPDCYDEYIGREPTGKIMKNFQEVVAIKTSDNKIIENKQDIIGIEKNYIKVIHYYGESLVGDYNNEEIQSINLDEYKKQLDSHFWDGFVFNITIENYLQTP